MGRYVWGAALAVLVSACSAEMGDGLDGGALLDGQIEDASDAGGGADAGPFVPDGGDTADGGDARDGGALDAGRLDDAGPMDAGEPDGGPPDAGMPDAGGDAGPPTCYATDLVIAAIDPGLPTGTIAIYNASGATIHVDETDYLLHEAPDSVLLRDLEPGVVLAPGALHRFPYPSAFSDGNASGEMALYRDNAIGSSSSMTDFVCWGFGHSPSFTVHPVAVDGGHWSGVCTPSIIGAEMRRITGTDGRTRTSYDPEGITPLFTCD